VSEGTVMNMKSWNKLPADQKKIVEDVCTNPFKVTGGLGKDDYKKIMADIQKTGVKMIDLPKAEQEQWYKRFQDVTRKWVSDMEAKKLNAKKVVAIMNEECEKRNVQLVSCPPEFKKA
ncbi:MAG: hypothetical protein KA801_08190, partial [Syntrophorhabdaceae bacterium]|nr:hypothetical protein [Syntrophorhabdaceae bacterium]